MHLFVPLNDLVNENNDRGSKFFYVRVPVSGVVLTENEGRSLFQYDQVFLYLLCTVMQFFEFQRDDEEAGFTEHRHTDTQEKNYNHDREGIKFYSSNIGQAGKALWKLQEDITRKSKKRKSRWLEKCKQDYDQSLTDMVKDVKKLMEVMSFLYVHCNGR